MRFYALLAAFAAVSISYAEAKSTAVTELEEFLGQTKTELEDIEKKLTGSKVELEKFALDDTDSPATRLAVEITAANAQNKNIAKCSESLQSGVNAASDNLIAAFNKCWNDNIPDFERLKREIQNNLDEATSFQTRYKTVMGDCKKKSYVKWCMKQYSPEKIEIPMWGRRVKNAEKRNKQKATRAFDAIKKCDLKLRETFKQQRGLVETNARNCIKNAKPL